MNVIDAINERRSVRSFKPDQVDRDAILSIMQAANQAPSWADTQPWEIFVAAGDVLDRLRQACLNSYEKGEPRASDVPAPLDWPPALKQRMLENMEQRFKVMGVDRNDQAAREANVRRNFEFYGAPVVVYLCLDKSLTPWSYFDLGLAAQNLMLAAKEFGIDSIPAVSLGAYPQHIRTELAIPDNLLILIGIALGYENPADTVNKPRSLRRPIEEAVTLKGV